MLLTAQGLQLFPDYQPLVSLWHRAVFHAIDCVTP